MSLLRSKFAKQAAGGLTATAVLAALALPNIAMGDEITLHRCTGDSGPICSPQVLAAVPISAQLATQQVSVDPSASSGSQSNRSTQDADNSNKAFASDVLGQAQKNVQVAGDQTNDLSNRQDVRSSADLSAESGATRLSVRSLWSASI